MKQHAVPETVTIDKSGANQAALDSINTARKGQKDIVIRQIKYLNNIIEQDHRFIKKITRPMMGFKSFCSAKAILAGIELMHMIRKGQWISSQDNPYARNPSRKEIIEILAAA